MLRKFELRMDLGLRSEGRRRDLSAYLSRRLMVDVRNYSVGLQILTRGKISTMKSTKVTGLSVISPSPGLRSI